MWFSVVMFSFFFFFHIIYSIQIDDTYFMFSIVLAYFLTLFLRLDYNLVRERYTDRIRKLKSFGKRNVEIAIEDEKASATTASSTTNNNTTTTVATIENELYVHETAAREMIEISGRKIVCILPNFKHIVKLNLISK